MCSLKGKAEGAAAAPRAKFEKTQKEEKTKTMSNKRQCFGSRGPGEASLRHPLSANRIYEPIKEQRQTIVDMSSIFDS